GRSWHVHGDRDDRGYQIDVRCSVVLPPDASLDVSSVNGSVSSTGIAGEQRLGTVNGNVSLAGARRDVRLNTVNGNIEGTLADLPKGADVKAETVNGNIVLRLPARAGFEFSGRTMSGEILSTFALPPSEADRAMEDAERERERARAEREKVRGERERIRAEAQRERERARRERERERERSKTHEPDEDGDMEIDIDMSELNESLKSLDKELAQMGREISRSVTMNLNRSYEGTVNGGGAQIRCSNLNGKILLLAEGTTEAQAKAIVSTRRGRSITVPHVPAAPHVTVHAPRPPMAPVAPMAPLPPRAPKPPKPPKPPKWHAGDESEEGSLVRGDIAGDFYSSLPLGDITLGKVSGKVKATTQSGQIHVGEAGNGAELLSSGGDVGIDSVKGDLKATTYGGEVRAGSVTGDARLETSGGDVVVRSCGGALTAKTGGGDISVKARGPIRAQTSGGSVTAELTSAQQKDASEISTSGGDVTLTLPANFKGDLDVRVNGVDSEGDYIVSEFPELSVSKRHGSQSAEGRLGGGGTRVTVRSTSGTVTIRKGPAA
ncbi:MAG TPA: DUF4097 family beta strand repeat-containing protein, partial [Thermoanaerobaculia bacterium]|nr:DUF4097 family beta strand repeat-containing protein [Thermoanaerobaculia bacterium]